MSISDLSRPPYFRDVSLNVAAARSSASSGSSDPADPSCSKPCSACISPSGDIRVDGAAVRFSSARDAVRAGLALVPEERQRQGLLFNLDIRHNLVLPSGAVARRRAGPRARRDRAAPTRPAATWRIKAASVDATPDSLSGGNQQKVVVAKWLAANPRVLLLDEPTKGVDVGAKFEIHEMIRRQAASGWPCSWCRATCPKCWRSPTAWW